LSQLQKQVLLARQPIYHKKHFIFGYELLFRNNDYLSAMDVGEDNATSEVLVNFCSSVINEIDTQQKTIFINVTETFLLSDAFLPIDKNLVVIELLEHITVTGQFINAVKTWKKKGFRFALDDFDFSAQWEPLIPYIDFIKVDVLNNSREWVAEKKQSIPSKKIQWLAEKIEDLEMLSFCEELGFTLFQGYYLAKPKLILGNSIRPSSAVTMEIIQKSSQSATSINEISDVVARDPKLSLQLLKLINSSIFTLPRPISNLKEAIVFLGIDTLKKWAILIAFVTDSPASIEACGIVLTRAKACELLISETSNDPVIADTAFLAGLLSGVDLLLELEPEFFIHQLNLGDELQTAILHHRGIIGSKIKTLKQLEYDLAQKTKELGQIELEVLEKYYFAQSWSNSILMTLQKS